MSGSLCASECGHDLLFTDQDAPVAGAFTDLGPGGRRASLGCLLDATPPAFLSPVQQLPSMTRRNSMPQMPTASSRLLSRRHSTGRLSVEVECSPSAKACLSVTPSRRLSVGRRPSFSAAVERRTEPWQEIKQLSVDQKIFDLFSWDEVLQEEGDGGKVVVCNPKGESTLPRRDYVLKMRSKESLRRDCMEEQFRMAQERLLNLPPHVGVLPLQEVLEDEHYYYVVMEHAAGGSFLPGLVADFKDGVMPEAAVKRVVRDILEAVGHVHAEGILHRDIKPDNLVFQESLDGQMKQSGKVALIDFDHADPEFNPTTPARFGFCGTVLFSAPEAIRGEFSQASDLYSVGVILYLLMTGKLPYPETVYEAYYDNLKLKQRSGCPWQERRRNWKGSVVQRMKDLPLDWTCNPWPQLPHCREFCQTLLAFSVAARPSSAEEALMSGWLSQPDN